MVRRARDFDPALLRCFRDAVREKISRDLENEAKAAEERRCRVRGAVLRGIVEARREGLVGDAWLFGSYAWGAPAATSDVDLLVEHCNDPMVVASIVGLLTGTDVHVVCVEDAPESLRARAVGDGVPL